MTYNKPEMTVAVAVEAIKGIVKRSSSLDNATGAQNATANAYEADE